MDFDQVYNPRSVLDRRALNDRLSRSRHQESSASQSKSSKDEDMDSAMQIDKEDSTSLTTGKVPLK